MAHRIARYKSGKYTVERPLHLGAALAGRLDDLAEPLSAFGLPLGEAFQLRDDILGTFGDPALTGKPVGEDLREGKPTPLLAIATARAGAAGLALLGRVGAADLTTRGRRPPGPPGRDGRPGRRPSGSSTRCAEAVAALEGPPSAARPGRRWPSWPTSSPRHSPADAVVLGPPRRPAGLPGSGYV